MTRLAVFPQAQLVVENIRKRTGNEKGNVYVNASCRPEKYVNQAYWASFCELSIDFRENLNQFPKFSQ